MQVRPLPLPPNVNNHIMKARSEQMADMALKMMLTAIERQKCDIDTVMSEYAAYHTDEEIEDSKVYKALATGYYGLVALSREIKTKL